MNLQPNTAAAAVELPPQEKAEFQARLRRHFKKPQIAEILAAAQFAAQAHDGQFRQNGAPYVIHPLAVAEIVSDWQLDKDAVIAALLHDVVEDTECTIADLEGRFGADVADIVNGVSKIEHLEHSEGIDVKNAMLSSAGTYRKMLLAISRDWRVILIKLADRIHNMRTLGNLKSRAKRRRISKETLEIYAPIAERLGFVGARDELQMLSFEHIHPLRFSILTTAIENSRQQIRRAIPRTKRQISNAMKKAGIKLTVSAREKNVYSIYRKMLDKHLTFNEVDDIIGFRLIVDSRLDCYTTLGVMHELFRPIPDKLKDYISHPKLNGYQSLHTTVLARNGSIVELQIRTWEMNRFAEQGLAAHWFYKENLELLKNKSAQQHVNQMLSSLMSMTKLGVEPGEFLSNMRLDLYPNEVFVLTPKGKVIELLRGATALDMAYAIHTDVGDKASGALINGRSSPISATLMTGDVVHIETADEIVPNPQWLNFAVTPRARSGIRARLKSAKAQELEDLGRSLLDRALKRAGQDPENLGEVAIERFMRHTSSFHTKHDLLTEIGLGKLSPAVVANEILGPQQHLQDMHEQLSISVAGDQRAGISRASCCSPLPPERIVGIIQKNKGIVVHRDNCSAVASMVGANKHISLHWDAGSDDSLYKVNLVIECANRSGLLADIMGNFHTQDINVVSINLDSAEQSNPVATIEVVVEVGTAVQIERLISSLNQLTGVTVNRASAS